MTEKQFLEQTHYVEDRFDLVLASDAQQRRTAQQIALLGKKLDHATELMAGQVLRDNARRRSQRTDPPMTSSRALTFEQLHAQQTAAYEHYQAKICAEAKAAYAARNPHRNDHNFL